MRILFAYFDFSSKDNLPSPRPLHDCALNFSTTRNFSVKREERTIDGQARVTYSVSESQKPEDECIPEGFWGDRIYNVTAIVGGNGSGKSTILHNMIKSVVRGLDPGLPFLLVLQKTDSEELYPYASGREFVWEGPGCLQLEYPKALLHTKTMLLDNTLSSSALELEAEYRTALIKDSYDIIDAGVAVPSPVPENDKQFCNKSLVASIRYSTEMSLARRRKDYIPVNQILDLHFNYESFQETRFLFDKFQQEKIQTLRGGDFSVPMPQYLLVSAQSVDAMWESSILDYIRSKTSIKCSYPTVCSKLQNYGFFGAILADTFLNLYTFSCGTFAVTIFDGVFADVANSIEEKNLSLSMNSMVGITEALLKKLVDYVGSNGWVPESLKIPTENCRRFVEFLISHLDMLSDIFQSPQGLDSEDERAYLCAQIDIRQTMNDNAKQKCIISFLDLYRPVCEPFYFLTFSSGMSSGEKNFLRMLTQFRYLLSGPPVYSDDSTEDNTQNALRNVFSEKDPYTCDTLFLFLDEADLTYHPEWQRIFISKLTTILPLMFRDPYNKGSKDTSGCRDIQVFLATHSPLMLGDFPKASVHYLLPVSRAHEASWYEPQQSTFGDNLYTILKGSFFMRESMGEFAKSHINDAVKWCKQVREFKIGGGSLAQRISVKEDLEKHFNSHRKIAHLLSPGIIQSKLLAELEECAKMLGITLEEKNESELDDLRRHNAELHRKLERANEALRKAGLLDEQDS